ncbi:hypothetical protein ABW19_dt0206469 [Dactylella cylindrospora]|nr:hypothetical protein ABW19_dt0206469 [Dactylella cylindrospora]
MGYIPNPIVRVFNGSVFSSDPIVVPDGYSAISAGSFEGLYLPDAVISELFSVIPSSLTSDGLRIISCDNYVDPEAYLEFAFDDLVIKVSLDHLINRFPSESISDGIPLSQPTDTSVPLPNNPPRGGIVGSSIGGFAFLLAVVGGFFLYWQWRKIDMPQPPAADIYPYYGNDTRNGVPSANARNELASNPKHFRSQNSENATYEPLRAENSAQGSSSSENTAQEPPYSENAAQDLPVSKV